MTYYKVTLEHIKTRRIVEWNTPAESAQEAFEHAKKEYPENEFWRLMAERLNNR